MVLRRWFESSRLRSQFMGFMAAAMLLGVAVTAVGEPPKDRPNRGRDLTGAVTQTLLTIDRNRMILILIQTGDIASGSSVGGGGFWKTTTDQYIFASGPNVAGITPDGTITFYLGGPFNEAGTGGPIFSGQGLDDFFVSTDPDDVGNFPDVCTVDDFRQQLFPSLASFAGEPFPGFADITVCTASSDLTVGTCGDCAGTRLGTEIVEVAFQFSVPAVQDFTFFIFRIFNRTEFITAANSPLQQAGPYDLTGVSVGYAIDPDLGEAGDDQIAFFPDVQTMVWWDSDFSEPQFQNPPGIGGVTYLKTPVDPVTGEEVGLAEFTVFTNGNPRPDPSDKETWYALMLGDPAEVVLEVDPRDVRGMASSALFPLPAGEFVEIYAAIFYADISGSPPAQLLAEGYKNLATGELIPTANDDPIFDNFRLVQQTAQATFDAGFVVPTAPPKPGTTLVAGDGQVTIVWDGAPVENINPFAKVARDPFARLGDGTPDPDAAGQGIFLAAGDEIFDPSRDVGGLSGFVPAETAGLTGREVTNAAFNLDFVIQDFQGFNVYRSFTGIADDAVLIAQFDLADGIAGGLFCNGATAVFDSDGLGGLAGVVCTETTTLDIGGDTGLGFAVIDRGGNFPDPASAPGLLNGIPISYSVTAFAVNPGQSPVTLPTQEALDILNAGATPAAPLVLESGLSPLLSSTPRSNASSFIDATIGDLTIVDGQNNPVVGFEADMPIDANGVLTGPIPPAGDFNGTVNIINPAAIPPDFDAFISIDRVDTVFNFVGGGGNYDDDFCGCGFGDGFNMLPGVDPRGKQVFWSVRDGSGSLLQTPEGPAEGSVFTDFIGFTSVTSFQTGTLSILAPEDPSLGVAFTVNWNSGLGHRSTTSGRGAEQFQGGVVPASVAVAAFQVGAYGQYGYGDYEVVWSNQGGVLTLSSVTDLSNGTAVPFSSTWGQPETWGFGAETGLGAAEEAVAAAIEAGSPGTGPPAPIARTASGKVVYPDPLWAFLGGQNTSFGAASQGAPHWTDLPFNPDVFDDIAALPGFPSFRAPVAQEGALQQTAPLYTCPAGGSFACAGAAGLQGTRLMLSAVWLDLSFNTLPADGETWVVQLPNAVANTPRPPLVGMSLQIPLAGGTNVLANADLSEILVVPNPFIAFDEITRGSGLQRIQFTQMPPQATVRIYTISGNLVRVLEHSGGSGTLEWDVRTRFDLFVASGNYYFHVTTPDGRTSLGRFAVIN